MGCKYIGVDNTNSARVMETGLVKFLKYIAGAYDYAKDGREFIPQNEPVGEDESKH